ncbi:MAG: TonB-dependent receptor domain-containing protein [Terriglobia bacterium]
MRKLAVLIVFISLGVAPMMAQYTTASLGGTVVDPAGAIIPGATVTVQNEGTGLAKTAETGKDGRFLFPVLPIGSYTLTVKKTGFTTYVQKGIVLTVNQAASLTARLQLGKVSQTVRVSANAAMITTRNATLTQLVGQKRIVDLPLNGREPQALLFLAPGAVNETGNYCLVACQGGVYPGEQDANVSGGGNRAVNYEMDGGDYNDTYLNTNLPFPNPDAIQEFSLQYDNQSAQYGLGAAVVNIVTKSGTNQFHGDAFEFVRNGSLNARNYFAPTQDTLKRNQYGGTIGGPIKKNKLFFFGTFQGTPTREAATGTIAFVPTPAERAGDFSAVSTPLINPATGAAFPSNFISPTLFSPPAVKMLQYIPPPNGPGNQITFTGPSLVENDYQWMTKVNWVGSKNQLTGSYFWTRFNEPPDITTAKTNLLAACPNGNALVIQNLSLNDTYEVSPTLLFNTWFGWNSQTGGSRSGAPFSFPDLGVNTAATNPPELSLFVGGFFNIETNHFGNFNRGTDTIREAVSLEHGSQDLHFGVEVVRLRNQLTNEFTMNAEFCFVNSLSGNNLSDFMLGDATDFLQGGGEFKNMVGTLWSPYVQDNWRVNHRLTVNMGLRWDPFIPYTETAGRVVCYIHGAKSQRFPNAPVGMVFGGSNHDPGCPAAGAYDNWENWAPRLGFAYHVKGTTVVRGGAGFYYVPLATHDLNGFVDTAPFGPRFDYVGDISLQNPWSSVGIPDPFPAEYGPRTPGPSATITLPVSIYATMPLDYQLPRTFTWNLNVEHQFGKNWLASIGYLGNNVMHLTSNALAFVEQNPAIYIPGVGPNDQPLSTASNIQQRRINPNFGSVGLLYDNYYSNYNALQLNLERRFSRGLSFTANYTWSKELDNIGSLIDGVPTTDPFDVDFDYGPSNDNFPGIFNFSAVWSVPTFHLTGVAADLLNNWELTSIATWHSGYPLTIYSGFDNSLTGVGADRADFTGTSISQAVLNPGRSHGQLISQYFDTSLFAPNAIGTFGTAGKGIISGPGYFDTDFGLLRNIKLTERASLQFRAEFFNLFNSVNFGAPDTSVADGPIFGTITSTAPEPPGGGGGAPRILQFALKLLF